MNLQKAKIYHDGSHYVAIACPIGVDDRKALLFDSFTCINEGEIIGEVSKEVIDQMPKCN